MKYLKEQRELDRCVFSLMEKRCQTLTNLSKSNSVLKKQIVALAVLRGAKLVSIALPPVRAAMQTIGEMGIESLKATITANVAYQETLIGAEKTTLIEQLRCGLPVKTTALRFERPKTALSHAAGSQPALNWTQTPALTEIWIKRLSSGVESFAHCEKLGEKLGEKTEISLESSISQALNGESYRIRFYRPSGGLAAKTEVNAFKNFFSF